MIDFIPEEHTLLIVVQGTLFGIPAPRLACFAGAWPRFAETTLPINTSSTVFGSTPALANAADMAKLPKAVAENPESIPPKLPIGVLTADTI
jgi:hypothetical protein